jgi:modulator of FtsH protease HflK
MLTDGENIVDINFVVFWRIKDATKYLFNIQKPEVTVKEVAESAMRDIVGQSNIQPLLTERGKRRNRPCRSPCRTFSISMAPASASTKSSCRRPIHRPRSSMPSATYKRPEPTRSACRMREGPTPPGCPGGPRRGRALQCARAYKEQTVAEATGQAARFLKVYEEYKKAPEVTRRRMYLETMERVLGGTDKIILDSKGGQGVVPFLPIDQLQKHTEEANDTFVPSSTPTQIK